METKKKRKKWPWVLLVIIVVLVILVTTFISNRPNMNDFVSYENYTVMQGRVTSTITGSGKLESVDTENIDVPDGMTVSTVFVEVGDRVVAGDTLAALDAESIKERVASLSGELSSLDKELARMDGSKTTEYVYASVKGRIKWLPVLERSDVIGSIAEYGSLALISTDELMQTEIETAQELALASTVTVKWKDESDSGEVAEKTANGYLITLDDEKAPYNESVQVYDGDTLLGEGILAIHAPVAVYANGGMISKIHYAVNDNVKATSKLFTLENEPFSDSYQQKYTERADKAEQLKNVLRYQNDPRIVAVSGGVISAVNITEGDETGTASASASSSTASSGTDNTSLEESTAFVTNTGGALKMEVSVDELDILSVVLDQNATVTLDAIASKKFDAKVTHISNLGNVDGSITTFPVYLTLSPDSRLLTGMNGNATILADQVDNVLIIPIEAISEDSSGAYVYVGSNREKTYITTGLSDGEYVEVTSGLSEGDVIQYIGSSSSSGFVNGPFGGGMQGPFDTMDGGETSNGD